MSITDRINLALAIVTALMALATLGLAWYTRNLAKGTTEGMRQAERHHQDDLRPFCLIDFQDATDQDPFGMRIQQSPASAAAIAVRGTLRNKGKGLAKDVVVYFNRRFGSGEEYVYRLTRPVVVSGLIGSGETLDIDVSVADRDVMQVTDAMAGWRPFEPIHIIKIDTYEIVLEYTDVFGNVFRTVHPRGIWHDVSTTASGDERAKQIEYMVSHNKPMPIFLAGRQAMRTIVDAPSLPYAPQPSVPGEPGPFE